MKRYLQHVSGGYVVLENHGDVIHCKFIIEGTQQVKKSYILKKSLSVLLIIPQIIKIEENLKIQCMLTIYAVCLLWHFIKFGKWKTSHIHFCF